ncbi:hypothetical protein [Streptomyces nigrescens]
MSWLRYEITAPDGREGIVAGVAFTAGRAVAEDPSPGALLYFRRHGYTVTRPDVPDSLPIGFAASENAAPAKPAPRPRGKQRSSKEE